VDEFGIFLTNLLLKRYSSFDFNKRLQEYAYHLLMSILWLSLSETEFVTYSNPNSGRGRCDLVIYPRIQASSFPAILFEFKKAPVALTKKKPLSEILESSAKTALKQIFDNLYCYVVPGYCNIMYEVGMSFYQRDFYFLSNKRERVGGDSDRWSAPLESGSFCSLDVVPEGIPVTSGVNHVPGTTQL